MAPEARPAEYELVEQTGDSHTARLLSPRTLPGEPNGVLGPQILRANGLQLFLTPFRKHAVEREKVVTSKNRTIANVRNTVHVLPLGIALLLIGLNCGPVFLWIDKAQPWMLFLQFVAKAHEVAMQASIAAVALACLRNQLLGNSNVPFGVIFAALQTAQLSSLWSSEFWAAVSHKATWHPKRWILLVAVPICILLAASVGPASAIAMIPRQVSHSLGQGSIFVNATSQAIFPQSLDGTNIDPKCRSVETMSSLWCPGEYFQTVAEAVIADTAAMTVSDAHTSNVPANLVYHGPTTIEPFDLLYPFQALLKHGVNPISALSTWGGDMTYTKIVLKKPYVQTRCWDCVKQSSSVDGQVILSPNPSGQSWRPKLNIGLEDTPDEPDNLNQSFLWVNPTVPQRMNYSLFVVRRASDINPSSAVCCGVQASWIDTKLDMRYARLSELAVTEQTAEDTDAQWDLAMKAPFVALSANWATSLLPLGFQNTSRVDLSTVDIRDAPSSLSRLIAAGMGNSVRSNIRRLDSQNYNTSFGYDLPYPTRGNRQSCGSFLGDVNRMCASSVGLQSVKNPYTISVTFYYTGYAYTLDGYPIKLAIAVLCLYCSLAITYIVYSATTGISSTAWDSVAEVTTLALNSERPSLLKNTSTGIETIETFRRPVNIRAKEGQGVQLVFADETDPKNETAYQKIVNNHAY